MHCFQGFADAQHYFHQSALGEAGVGHEVGVDCVLEITAAVVGEEDVDGFAVAGACVADAGNLCACVILHAVVDAVYYVRVGGEEGVGFDFLEGL